MVEIQCDRCRRRKEANEIYRQYCRRYSEWADSKQLTVHIQRYPGVNLELDYARKQLYLHNRRNSEETTKVTIFIAALT